MKITIKGTKTVATSKTIELPYYLKTSCHFYKIYDADNAICITDLGGHESIFISRTDIALSCADKKSNAKEFEAAFDRISKLLISKS